MQIKNVEIRKNIENNNLKFWQIAEALNINDGNFSRLLRKELPKDKKEKILKIIEDLKKEENDETNKDILNIKELSQYIHCSISMIRKMIYDNQIPYFKIGNRYLFNLSIIQRWITNKYNDIEIGDFDNEIKQSKNICKYKSIGASHE